MDSNTYQIFIQLLMGLLYAIPSLIFIGISIYYISKMGTLIDGILILIGNIIILLSIAIGKILWIQFVFFQTWQRDLYSYISTAISIFSVLGSILFAIGVFLLVKRVIRSKTQVS